MVHSQTQTHSQDRADTGKATCPHLCVQRGDIIISYNISIFFEDLYDIIFFGVLCLVYVNGLHVYVYIGLDILIRSFKYIQDITKIDIVLLYYYSIT